uniref:Serrate RNA effector molecule homolog n=1 Tax=Brugia malayi TaxID=6279 RepID=A0A0J9XVH6_BRUMA|nr:Bm3078, isoform a [Brugia malayi]
MGDSDDEYHRRGGRDKFARERNDYPDRIRRDYEYDSASDTYDPVMKTSADEEPVPVMMTFKKFLATQDDSITDEEAIAKYSEYKLEFKRQELHKFFLAHKDEEWFRLKYHPEDSGRRKAEQKENVLRRLEIFQNLYDEGCIDKLQIDYDYAPQIILISVVVKLEGGTEDDIAALKSEKIDDESVLDETKKKIAEINGEENKSKQEKGGENPNDDGAITDSDDEKEKQCRNGTDFIFLRNVAPNITMEEIETACKRFPGFLRVGLADPVPDRKFYRRGWVTFRRDVNIKEICWNLNSVRIKECDLGAVINRDIARRVRSVNGITGHKQVAQNDLRQAAKLAAIYDKKNGLYQSENQEERQSSFELDVVAQSQNPLLKNLTDFLIEEANAEEEELLGISSGEYFKVPFQRDDALIARLDRIITYLRIVHSIDFYNHGEYPNEDVMPNRCGMMHVRGAPPSSSQWGTDDNGRTLVAQKFVTDFIAGFNNRIETALMSETSLNELELDNLGRKDTEKEVESFITANCVELAKDKWLCPLSGKKFKGPEFIRKHLTTKHGEKLDQVRQETVHKHIYLNEDSRCISRFSDYDGDRSRASGGGGGNSSYSDRDRRGYERNIGGSSGGRYASSYGGRNYDRGGTSRYWESSGSGRRDPREPVTYKDLDAPEDIF